jgi:hypothetical protein
MSPFQEQSIREGKPLVVWRFVDGKAGHEAQTFGLVQALARRRTVECVDFVAQGRAKAVWSWLTGRFSGRGGAAGSRFDHRRGAPDAFFAVGGSTCLRGQGGGADAAEPAGVFVRCLSGPAA